MVRHRALPHLLEKKHVVTFSFFFLMLLLGIVYLYRSTAHLPSRVGLVVVGSPYRVIVWDRPRGALTSMILPDDVVIDLVHGYGRLPVRSLLSLDQMEKQHGNLIRDSIADAVGFPIDFYLVTREERTEETEERSNVRHIFSFGRLIPLLLHQVESNIPFFVYGSIARVSSGISTQSVTSISAEYPGVITEGNDADGSVVRIWNGQAFDAHVGSLVEDTDIASERLSVALFNASEYAGLGQKASRLMEKSGVHVVSIGNTGERGNGSCTIETTKTFMDTKTVQFIKRVLGCVTTLVSSEGETVADIRVILNPPWASRYEPFKK